MRPNTMRHVTASCDRHNGSLVLFSELRLLRSGSGFLGLCWMLPTDLTGRMSSRPSVWFKGLSTEVNIRSNQQSVTTRDVTSDSLV